MKNQSKNMNTVTALTGIAIFVAALFINENRALFTLMDLSMYAATRKNTIRR